MPRMPRLSGESLPHKAKVEKPPVAREVPDEVVAGIRWLQDQGWTWKSVRLAYPGLPESFFIGVRGGYARAHVQPKPPAWLDEKLWDERFRWPRSTEPEETK